MKNNYEADVKIIEAMANGTQGFTGELEELGGNSIKLHMGQYNILIDLPYDYDADNLEFWMSTVRYDDVEETERNQKRFKTERGVRNYINKFSN